MRRTVDVMGVPVDSVTMEEALEIIKGFLDKDEVHTVFTPNAEIMMAAQRDSRLKEILCQADLLVADGAGVVLASRILGTSVPEKVAGFDLVKNILIKASEQPVSLFLFGGKPGVAEAAAENILKQFPGVSIAGCRNGYFSKEEEDGIVSMINSSGADILLTALGAPKQEKWIDEYKNRLNVKMCIGVGGTLDVFAGKVELAPEFFRRNGLEWLYRLYKEPWRYKRMLDLPRFMLLTIGKRLKRNCR
jgi:N-acetylglucosaminyldiphosphoundecaprenol N-acetyl-beta-D-mannosaminyltransferase